MLYYKFKNRSNTHYKIKTTFTLHIKMNVKRREQSRPTLFNKLSKTCDFGINKFVFSNTM